MFIVAILLLKEALVQVLDYLAHIQKMNVYYYMHHVMYRTVQLKINGRILVLCVIHFALLLRFFCGDFSFNLQSYTAAAVSLTL